MSEIPIQAKVIGPEGPCGETVGIVMDRASRQVKYYVVKVANISDPQPRLVEVDQATSASAQELTLKCGRDRLLVMVPFVEQNYILAELPENRTAWNAAGTNPVVGGAAVTRGSMEATGGSGNIGPGQVYIRPDLLVHTTGGSTGKLLHLLADENGVVTGAVLQEGRWWSKKQVTVPLTQVDYVEENKQRVKVEQRPAGGEPPSQG